MDATAITYRELFKPDTVYVLYDGECPMCSMYSNWVEIRRAAGKLEAIDVREHREYVAAMEEQGLNIDQGFVVVKNGTFHHAADALQVIAALSEKRSLLDRLNYQLFSRRGVTGALYPFLKAGRNGLLWLLGREKYYS